MILNSARWLSLLGCLMAFQAHAVAPVVDESEHFASYDDEGVSARGSETAQPKKYAAEDVPLVQSMPEDPTQKSSLQDQIRALQQDLQNVRGELEVQAHRIEQLNQVINSQAQKMKGKSDARLKQEPSDTPVSSVNTEAMTSSSTAAHINPADEQISYLAAYDLVKSKRYDEALAAMQAFIQNYPRGGYTANAEYWTGELFLAKNQPEQAIHHFDAVLKQFPSSSKAAASSLKIGYALTAMGKKEEAKQRFKEVIQRYPDTAAAQLAKSKLQGL